MTRQELQQAILSLAAKAAEMDLHRSLKYEVYRNLIRSVNILEQKPQEVVARQSLPMVHFNGFSQLACPTCRHPIGPLIPEGAPLPSITGDITCPICDPPPAAPKRSPSSPSRKRSPSRRRAEPSTPPDVSAFLPSY